MSHRGSIISTLARSFVVSLAVAVALLGAAAPVWARSAPPSTSPSTTGNDISYPQCGKSFPTGQAFGIVGVNGGLANRLNPCLGEYNGGPTTSELYWAWGSSGSSKLPKVALYVNTADPGPGVADWPKTSANTDPFGSCDGSDSPACAWQYGWDRAVQDMDWLVAAATQVGVASTTSAYRWWLDVETANSWEAGSSGLANNVADLQGMVAAFTARGATVGIYSTASQWNQVTGGSTAGSLNHLSDWIPGARTLSGAKSNCALAGFTGLVTVAQWFGKPYDGDWAC
ncbi:MAG: hypothetical protein ACYDCI_11780 [Candidatus Limnocylindrales bacterium]